MYYEKLSAQELEREYASLKRQYENEKGRGLCLNMARGKPGSEQLDLSNGLLDILSSKSSCIGTGNAAQSRFAPARE